MARKRHSDEDILKLLRELEVRLASGSDVSTACRAAGISDATYSTPGARSSAAWRVRSCPS
jgi:hypothetical protein